MPPDLDDCEHLSKNNLLFDSFWTIFLPHESTKADPKGAKFQWHSLAPRFRLSVVHFGSLLYLLDALGELVDTFARVIGVHIRIFRSEVPPLKAVHGTKVAFLPVGESKAGWSAEPRRCMKKHGRKPNQGVPKVCDDTRVLKGAFIGR